ncbi:hypothetical protein BGZ65_006756 [Modicella reniformis]|uniref:Uncharacterized protein n=1 Tax=Modicella reniformis TaxID=1440133 RepID=A0A9P6MG54_9FUNG|nr:hypothetical protein BGZ65_006756 [Modicella reniformis]
MPFRAAKKVVTSVTSVGTGLLPSKEQLGSIPVAGRILKHPVMDSTLTYIASKTTHRGKRTGIASKVILPEDVHYRKINKKLVDESITLASLAIEKEEQSKTMDDEAGDDAFELYLAAIATLMHALPIETCDPLRREAFESQLRNFLKDNQLDTVEEGPDLKQLRRHRRRRHREHHHYATTLIYEHSVETANMSGRGSRHPQDTQQHRGQHETTARRIRWRRGRKYGDGSDRDSPTLSETIISTAVQSAIRLKQSPIPDVIKTCLHASRVIISKIDEKFHLQEKAWQLSKQSIEKVIELDEQYAIHEVMTETLFATVTGLVKAGIAYMETPGYSDVKTLTNQEQNPDLNQGAPAPVLEGSHNHQTILEKKASLSGTSSRRRRYSTIAEEGEERILEGHNPGLIRHDSEDSSPSCFTTSEEEEKDSEYDGLGRRSRRRKSFNWKGRGLLSTAASGFVTPYFNDDDQQKTGFAMALKGATSYVLSTLATK